MFGVLRSVRMIGKMKVQRDRTREGQLSEVEKRL